jgi:hypothetical protein
MKQRDEDLSLLRKIIAYAEDLEEDDGRLSGETVKAFEDMLVRLLASPFGVLSDKQRRWAAGVWERLDGAPAYENLYSRGLVPDGRPVPTPTVLQNLPKKPPTRRAS